LEEDDDASKFGPRPLFMLFRSLIPFSPPEHSFLQIVTPRSRARIACIGRSIAASSTIANAIDPTAPAA
jgi:hypothetical protein